MEVELDDTPVAIVSPRESGAGRSTNPSFAGEDGQGTIAGSSSGSGFSTPACSGPGGPSVTPRAWANDANAEVSHVRGDTDSTPSVRVESV